MKYFYLLTISIIFGFNVSKAQIVIEASDLTKINGQKIYERGLSITGFTNFQVGPDMQWDFSNEVFVGNEFEYEYNTPVPNPAFPSATHSMDLIYTVGGSGLYVPGTSYFELNQNGFFDLGTIYPEVFLPLNEDGSANATVLGQASIFTAPLLTVELPIVFDSNVEINQEPIKRGIDIVLNVPPLENAPFKIDFQMQQSLKTVGWGKLKLPEYENEEDVIVVEELRLQQDSFFLYDGPAPEILLSTFGLVQGGQNNTRTLYFYAKGYPQPILTLYLNSTGQVMYASQILYNPTMSVNDNDVSNNQTNVFPNPSNGTFTVDYKDLDNAKYIEVYDMNGILVLKNNLELGNSQSTFRLLNPMNGSYIYSINNESGKVLSSGKLLITR